MLPCPFGSPRNDRVPLLLLFSACLRKISDFRLLRLSVGLAATPQQQPSALLPTIHPAFLLAADDTRVQRSLSLPPSASLFAFALASAFVFARAFILLSRTEGLSPCGFEIDFPFPLVSLGPSIGSSCIQPSVSFLPFGPLGGSLRFRLACFKNTLVTCNQPSHTISNPSGNHAHSVSNRLSKLKPV